MVKRLIAIAFIFCCTSIAWLILGGTIMARTGSSAERLRGRVESVWGAPHLQSSPFATYNLLVPYTETVTENGRQRIVERTRFDSHTVRPSASDVAVVLQNEPRQKGLLWYATYKINFYGDYVFRNPERDQQAMRFYLPLPAGNAVYDDLQFVVNGQPSSLVMEKETAYVPFEVMPNQSVKVQVTYRSQGLDSWKYSFGQDVNPVENFHLRMTTNFGSGQV